MSEYHILSDAEAQKEKDLMVAELKSSERSAVLMMISAALFCAVLFYMVFFAEDPHSSGSISAVIISALAAGIIPNINLGPKSHCTERELGLLPNDQVRILSNRVAQYPALQRKFKNAVLEGKRLRERDRLYAENVIHGRQSGPELLAELPGNNFSDQARELASFFEPRASLQ
jgi:hypothetical protein